MTRADATPARDARGMSGSVQWALLVPVLLLAVSWAALAVRYRSVST